MGSGNLPMSCATIASTIWSELRLIVSAALRLPRMPVTTMSGACAAGAVSEAAGGYAYPRSQTPWQEIQRRTVGQLGTGAILEGAERYQRIDERFGVPRDSH